MTYRLCKCLTGLMAIAATLTGCSGLPEGITPVENFDASRYMGRWYEIARLDHSFERGQSSITATYTLQDDNTIEVLNQGYHEEKGEWRQATGVARAAGSPDIGHLEVSFFGPFYSSYVIFELEENYDYAFVTGFNRDYLWLLARTPRVDETVKQRFETRATDLGFDTSGLIWVNQDRH